MLGRGGTDRTSDTSQLGMDNSQTLDGVDCYNAAGEERINVPGAVELRPIACRVDVEITDLAEIRGSQIDHLQDTKPSLIVGLIDEIPRDVLVVIDRRVGREVTADENGARRVQHVPHIGLRIVAKILFIELIVNEEIPVVGGQHSLVGIPRSQIRGARYLDGGRLVGDVDHGHRVLIGSKTKLFSAVRSAGARVSHTLDVMGIPVGAETSRRRGGQGIRDVDEMQAPGACCGPHRIGEARALVDPNVVRACEPCVVDRCCKGRGEGRHAPELRQVEDLHPVPCGFAHNERVVAVDLYIAPIARDGLRRQIPHIDRECRTADVHKRGPGAAAHDDVLHARHRICPPPSVGSRAAPDTRHGKVGMKVDVFAAVNIGRTARTRGRLGSPWRGLRDDFMRVRGAQRPVRGSGSVTGHPGRWARLHIVGEQDGCTGSRVDQYFESPLDLCPHGDVHR